MIWTVPSIFFLSACAAAVSESAVCSALERPTDAHAETLFQSDHEASVVTGANLIAIIDAGCQF